MNSVNVISDDFGHGVFDGYSIVVGHEYAEAVTDPDNFASDQDGWNDVQGSENGDKCAWTSLANVSMTITPSLRAAAMEQQGIRRYGPGLRPLRSDQSACDAPVGITHPPSMSA